MGVKTITLVFPASGVARPEARVRPVRGLADRLRQLRLGEARPEQRGDQGPRQAVLQVGGRRQGRQEVQPGQDPEIKNYPSLSSPRRRTSPRGGPRCVSGHTRTRGSRVSPCSSPLLLLPLSQSLRKHAVLLFNK